MNAMALGPTLTQRVGAAFGPERARELEPQLREAEGLLTLLHQYIPLPEEEPSFFLPDLS